MGKELQSSNTCLKENESPKQCTGESSVHVRMLVQVVAAGPQDMRMYYHSFDPRQQRFVVGWASSPDGFK